MSEELVSADIRCCGVPSILATFKCFRCSHFCVSVSHTVSATLLGAMINVEPLNCSAMMVRVVAVFPKPGGKNSPTFGVCLAMAIKFC